MLLLIAILIIIGLKLSGWWILVAIVIWVIHLMLA